MSEYRFTKTHEWIALVNGVWRVGISDYAQGELGDITYVELPEVGTEFMQKEPVGSIESVKALSDFNAPVDFEVVGINEDLDDQPELVNEDAMGKGYLLEVEVKDPGQVDMLMDITSYDEWEKSE